MSPSVLKTCSFAAGPLHALPPQAGPGSAWGAHHLELDDATITGNDPCEADIDRAVVVDEEALQAAHQQQQQHACAAAGGQQQQQPDLELEAPGTSYASWLQQEYLETAKLLLAGGVAGAFSKSCTAPLARLTILLQASRQRSATPILPALAVGRA